MTDFPKVLIITKTLINDIDSGGASLRNWFKEWPREHLAQLYSGVAIDRDPFCGFNFQIGLNERRFGRLFSKLKGSPLGNAAQPFRYSSGLTENRNSGWWKKAIYKAGNLLTQIEILVERNDPKGVIPRQLEIYRQVITESGEGNP